MNPIRSLPLLVVLALLAVACSSGGSSAAPSAADAWGPPATPPKLTPVLVTNAIAKGKARILFLYLDSKNTVASAPDRTAKVAFYDLATDRAKPVTTVDGEFVWTIENERGMYVVNADFPTAGTWGAEFTTEAPNSPPETVRLTFDVRESTPTVKIGAKAPASKTPTAADVGGDLAKISTDAKPDPAFYQTSVADALAAHKPFMLVFATPKFCTSQQCGPTLDQFKPIAKANPDVTFINVEPYKLAFTDGALQPVLDANGQLQATDITNEWGLLSEPWIFAVDRDGVVQGSYEVTITPSELESILPVITKGGGPLVRSHPPAGRRRALRPRSGTTRGPA
ncbi:MAG: hypothetical protein ACJ77Y_02790, partial [Chloroflexota bacterium]